MGKRIADRIFVKERDNRYDILRAIGLLCIILAHVNPPFIIFQLRNFDVPLMVFVSAAVYFVHYKPVSYVKYFINRVLRLIVPTWIFLILYFLIFYGYGKLPSNKVILDSFLLIEGIGFVWIIRVFLLVALISPLLMRWFTKYNNKKIYLLTMFFAYFIYEISYYLLPLENYSMILSFIITSIMYYIIPYGFITGIIFYAMSHKKRAYYMLFLFVILLIISLLLLHTFDIQSFKYPPRIFYISYAMTISFILYFFSNTGIFKKIFDYTIITFIGRYSLWIYLWHILVLTVVWGKFDFLLGFMRENLLIKYLITVVLSVVITYIQRVIIKRIIDLGVSFKVRYWLSVAFLK